MGKSFEPSLEPLNANRPGFTQCCKLYFSKGLLCLAYFAIVSLATFCLLLVHPLMQRYINVMVAVTTLQYFRINHVNQRVFFTSKLS